MSNILIIQTDTPSVILRKHPRFQFTRKMKVETQKPNLLLKYETATIKNTFGIQEYARGTSQPYPHYKSRPKTKPFLNTTKNSIMVRT